MQTARRVLGLQRVSVFVQLARSAVGSGRPGKTPHVRHELPKLIRAESFERRHLRPLDAVSNAQENLAVFSAVRERATREGRRAIPAAVAAVARLAYLLVLRRARGDRGRICAKRIPVVVRRVLLQQEEREQVGLHRMGWFAYCSAWLATRKS